MEISHEVVTSLVVPDSALCQYVGYGISMGYSETWMCVTRLIGAGVQINCYAWLITFKGPCSICISDGQGGVNLSQRIDL